jgi:putative hydrolase of the HAD superfamily
MGDEHRAASDERREPNSDRDDPEIYHPGTAEYGHVTTVETVLFDLDDTLCTYTESTEAVLRDAFSRVGVDPFFDTDDFERWIPKVHAESALDLREQCFAGIARERGRDPAVGHAVAAAYEPRPPEAVDPVPGAEAALSALGEEFRLGLVTNGARETQHRKLDALGFADSFETVVCATPETAIKPDPDPIHRALDAPDTDPAEAVLVGDSLASDVAGARNAGVTPVWVGGDGGDAAQSEPVPSVVVESVADLADRPYPWSPD